MFDHQAGRNSQPSHSILIYLLRLAPFGILPKPAVLSLVTFCAMKRIQNIKCSNEESTEIFNFQITPWPRAIQTERKLHVIQQSPKDLDPNHNHIIR